MVIYIDFILFIKIFSNFLYMMLKIYFRKLVFGIKRMDFKILNLVFIIFLDRCLVYYLFFEGFFVFYIFYKSNKLLVIFKLLIKS